MMCILYNNKIIHIHTFPGELVVNICQYTLTVVVTREAIILLFCLRPQLRFVWCQQSLITFSAGPIGTHV
jgi:hypothetical protein